MRPRMSLRSCGHHAVTEILVELSALSPKLWGRWRVASVARMSEATSGSTTHAAPHVAALMRAPCCHRNPCGIKCTVTETLGAVASRKRSPDERSDIRVYLACGPACRCAHAGTMLSPKSLWN